MKYLAFVTLLFSAIAANGQKVLSDKKDPFTATRNIVTDLVPLIGNKATVTNLTVGISVAGYLNLTDTSKIISLYFYSPTTKMSVSSTDTLIKECLIKLENGKIIRGSWSNTTEMEGSSMLPPMTVSSYIFSKSDIQEMTASKVTDIKVSGDKNHQMQLSDIQPKNQGKIKDLATLLLKYL